MGAEQKGEVGDACLYPTFGNCVGVGVTGSRSTQNVKIVSEARQNRIFLNLTGYIKWCVIILHRNQDKSNLIKSHNS